MTLPTSTLKNKQDIPFIPLTLPETYTIGQVEDWGYGCESFYIPFLALPSTPNDVSNNLTATIASTPVTFTNTTPTAGQIRIWQTSYKNGFWETNSADNGKTLIITNYRGMASANTVKKIKEQNTQINTNTTDISTLKDGSQFKVSTYANLPSASIAAIGVLYYIVDTGKRFYSNGTTWTEFTGGGGVTPTVTFTPANGVSGQLTTVTPYADFNKWLDDVVTGKMKLYPTSADRIADTNAIAGTPTRTSNKRMTFTPASALTNNAQCFGRVFSGLAFADGTILTANQDWAFVVGTIANLAPTATVQAITAATPTVVGSTLTGHYTYADNEADPEGVSTFRWLRNAVAIAGATAITYVLVEADVGTNITFEVTPVATTGTLTGTPVTSANFNIPIPAPPAISLVAGNGKVTCTFVQDATLATETYNAYYTIDSTTPTTASTKLTGVVSPFDVTATNGTTVKVALEMVVNSVASALSTVVSGIPFITVNITDFTSQSAIIGSVLGGGGAITHAVTETIVTTADTQYAYDYYKTAVDKTVTRTYKLRAKVTAPSTATYSMTTFGIYQTNSPATIYADFISGQEYRVIDVSYTVSGKPNAEWRNASSVLQNNIAPTINTVNNTDYDYVVETTPTQVRLEIRQTDTTVIASTGWVNWTSLKDTGASLWVVWGDPLNWAWNFTEVASSFQVS